MAIYAIADLHLSFSTDKPMDIFGDNWTDHAEQIKKNWTAKIEETDLVLVPGDISWALHLKDAVTDLLWLRELPGTIAIIRGNHDYWWSTLTKMQQTVPGIHYIQNNSIVYGNVSIAGTRGWICPGNQGFEASQDEKIYARELNRMRLSLEQAKKSQASKKVVMIHYPPFSDKGPDPEFEKLFLEYQVETVLYGHIHQQFDHVMEGNWNGVQYHLVSSDYLQFNPIKLSDTESVSLI